MGPLALLELGRLPGEASAVVTFSHGRDAPLCRPGRAADQHSDPVTARGHGGPYSADLHWAAGGGGHRGALQGVVTKRPMTHDLMRDMLTELGVVLDYVVITELKDQTFYAELRLRRGGNNYVVSARPSDAIALAIRAGRPSTPRRRCSTPKASSSPSATNWKSRLKAKSWWPSSTSSSKASGPRTSTSEPRAAPVRSSSFSDLALAAWPPRATLM